MSSKGPIAAGTDGTDFLHRQKVASHYRISLTNKSRLKFCLVLHILLAFVMLLKLLEDIFDRLDIFILELEELYIPKPQIWEWMWFSSLLLTWVGARASQKSQSQGMKLYAALTTILALGPVIYALAYFFSDFYSFVNTRDITTVQEVWRGYPIALLWYAFLLPALQVHLFQLFTAVTLIRCWTVKKRE